MTADHKLRWVQRNRSARPDPKPVGSWMAALARSVGVGSERTARIAARIDDVVDDAFRKVCRVAEVHGSTVVIRVAEAGLVHPMKARWTHRLTTALTAPSGPTRSVRVVFAFGDSGRGIGPDLGTIGDQPGNPPRDRQGRGRT